MRTLASRSFAKGRRNWQRFIDGKRLVAANPSNDESRLLAAMRGQRRTVAACFRARLVRPQRDAGGRNRRVDQESGTYLTLPFSCPFRATRGRNPLQAGATRKPWKSVEKTKKTGGYGASANTCIKAQKHVFPGSGPGGRWFESTRPDQIPFTFQTDTAVGDFGLQLPFCYCAQFCAHPGPRATRRVPTSRRTGRCGRVRWLP